MMVGELARWQKGEKMMKKLLTLVAALPLLAMAETSTPVGFTDNLDEALAAAKANGKYVFVCFSGSDWCGWCMKLEREVLSKPKFLDGVTNDFELVFIDMPQDKSLLSERAKIENEKLVEKYRVQGFPTALVLDGEGVLLTKTGYRKGGAKKYVAHMKDIRKKGPQLRIEGLMFEQHVAPFENEIRRILHVDLFERINSQIEKLPEETQEATAKELVKQYLPDVMKKIEAAVSDFKTKEVPELVAKEKAEAIENAENILSKMKKDLEQ